MNQDSTQEEQFINQLPAVEDKTFSEQLNQLLQNDPQFRTKFDNYVTVKLREQYDAGLQELNTVMQNPKRKREDVYKVMSEVRHSGTPALEHLPSLMALERTTREAGGSGYHHVEEMVFTDLSRLIRKDDFTQNQKAVQQLLAFLEETFRYKRMYDSFAAQRRNTSLKMTIIIAARTGNERALAHEALAHPVAKVRGAAIVVIYDSYEWLGRDIPAELIDRFQQMADKDGNPKVRDTARAVLQRLGAAEI